MASFTSIPSSGGSSTSRIVADIALSRRENLFNGFSHNINGLFNNIDELTSFLTDSKMHFGCISETFLNDNISDAMVSIPGYNIIRKDRVFRPLSRGGVAIYLRKGFKFKTLSVPDSLSTQLNSDLEFLFIEVSVGSTKCLLGSLYNPPIYSAVRSYSRVKRSIEDLALLLSHFTAMYEYCFIMGDVNFDLLKTNLSLSSNYLNMVHSLGLLIFNRIFPTHDAGNHSDATLIDHLIVLNNDHISYFDQLSPLGSSHHELLYFSVDLPCQISEYTFSYRDFKSFDFAQAIECFNSLNWWAVGGLDSGNLNHHLEAFNNNINIMFNSCIPIKTITIKKNKPPWFSNTIESHITTKKRLYLKWKRHKSNGNWENYTQHRNFLTGIIRSSKAAYLSSKCDPALPPKKFWANIKNLGLGNKKCSSSTSCPPDVLNNYFCENFSTVSEVFDCIDPCDSNNGGFFFKTIDVDELLIAVSSVNPGSVGWDNINLKFIKLIFPLIGDILVDIFNCILTYSQFPSSWKRSIIIPIPKVKLPSAPSDFRPISILPSLSKVLERLMFNQMSQFFEMNSLLGEFQSGFRSKHSTSTALLKITDDIRMNTDVKKLTFLCLLDFSKAFDTVVHGRLCNKLVQNYKFSRSAASLIFSYLTDRSQLVRIDNVCSCELEVSSGVPQGSILGPLLFCLYIADVSRVIRNSSFHLYADDLQLYLSCDKTADSIAECIRLMNGDLEGVASWAAVNGLVLNAAKSQSIVMGGLSTDVVNFPELILNNTIIPFSPTVKNLGVFFSGDLKWDFHIDRVCLKIFNIIRTLWKVTYFGNTDLRRRLFLSFVFPHFLYADAVLYGMSEGCMKKLNRCFNACIRYVFRLNKYDHISSFRNRLIGCDLSTYFDFKICWFIKRLLTSRSPTYLYNKLNFSFDFNNNLRLIVRSNRLRCSNSSAFVKGVSLWNNLPVTLKRVASRSVFMERFVMLRRGSEYV